MKRLIAVAATLALGGCGLPPIVSVASYALDGMSLLSTGKSVSDHAISAAVQKDCAVWRVIINEDVCREFNTGKQSPVMLAAEKSERGTEIVGLTEVDPHVVRSTDSKPVMLALIDPVVLTQFTSDGAGLGIRLPSGPIADPLGAIERAPNPDLLARASADAPWLLPVDASERARETTRPPGRVLVLGSFTRLDNAERIARLWSGFRPAIVGARLGGETFHRVIIEAPGGDVDRRRHQLASLGQSVWAADVCAGGNSAGNVDQRCVVLPAVIRR